MNKLSIVESLELLAPSPDDKVVNSGKKKITKKKNTRSPVKIPQVSPVRNELEAEIEEEKEERKDLYSMKKKKIIKEEEEEENSPKNNSPLEDKEVLKAPHTPTRFKMEAPITPTRNFNQLPDKASKLNLYERLKDKRYTLLKYIISEDEDRLIYVVCYDPNGQILFVKIDENLHLQLSIEEKNIITVKRNYDDLVLDAFQSAIQERMTIEIQGVVFYDGSNYIFALHHNNGTIENIKYDIINYQENKKLVICETYTVVNFKEIEKETTMVLEMTKKNYQLIQQQQLLISTNTIDNLITSANNHSNVLKKFIEKHKKYTDNIIDDWGYLGACSADYYQKYGEGKLTESDKEKFDKISINMFARFQAFNEQLMLINQLNANIPDIDKSSQLINKISEEIEYQDTKMSGNIVEIENLNISV
jgi:hypothetical protein